VDKAVGLTTKRIAKLRRRQGRFHDGHGLYLQVLGPKSASWILRYVKHGKERMLGLGPLIVVGLKEARERAKAARLQLLDGIDPVEDRKAKKVERALAAAKTMSFADCAAAYHTQHEGKWKNAKHAAQFLSTLRTYAFPVIGTLPIASIDTPLVLKVVEPIWQDKTETASRTRGRIESVLDWATVRGYRSGDNPARWKGHLDQVLPARGSIAKVEHHAALPYRELPAFMADLRGREGVAARSLEFTILTAARTGEVIGARWDEIDTASATWIIPAGRMKGSREHRVPLSSRAVELLEEVYREDGNDYVFLGSQRGGSLSNMAMTATLKRMGRADITVHGFRSTFRDWAAERTNFPNHVAEMALAHVIGDKVEASYRRGDLFDKRRKLMEAWASYCSRPAGDGTVVVLRSVDA
jgi:integrase